MLRMLPIGNACRRLLEEAPVVNRLGADVVDAHSHIGAMEAWKFYDLKEPVKPTVYDFPDRQAYLGHIDRLGVQRALVLPNYGIPVQEQPFSLNDIVLDAVSSSDRLIGGLWVSFLPQNKDLTLKALENAGEPGIVALKTTFLLGGNPNPNEWDEQTQEVAEACFAAAEQHDLVFHFHTSPGGASDINNYIPLVQRYAMRVKTHLVHFGGGVSGHIRLVTEFLDCGHPDLQALGHRRPVPLLRDRAVSRGECDHPGQAAAAARRGGGRRKGARRRGRRDADDRDHPWP